MLLHPVLLEGLHAGGGCWNKAKQEGSAPWPRRVRALSVKLKLRMRGDDMIAHAEKCERSSVALARFPTSSHVCTHQRVHVKCCNLHVLKHGERNIRSGLCYPSCYTQHERGQERHPGRSGMPRSILKQRARTSSMSVHTQRVRRLQPPFSGGD